MEKKTITPIGYVKSPFKEKFGLPRQGGRVPDLTGEIVFFKPYSEPEAFKMLDGYSHVWVIFDFNKAVSDKWHATVRPPRLGGNERAGVFATRSPFRPNGLGLSVVKLESINVKDGEVSLSVSGIDLLDGTPVYDIKPYLTTADLIVNAKGGFAEEKADYSVKVIVPDNLSKVMNEKDLNAVISCLKDDPRPSYQNDNRTYGMQYKDYEIKFSFNNGEITVTDIKKA